MFGRTGKWIAEHPWWVILLTHFIVLFFSCGFLYMKFEKNTGKLYNPQNSEAEKDLDRASKHFLLKMRREMLILTPKKDHPRGVLTNGCFMDALLLHRAIIGLENYRELCIQNPRNQCVVVTPLEIFGYNPKFLNNITTKLSEVYRNKAYTMSNGRPAYYNFPAIFGKTMELDPKRGTVERAGALQMIYIMQDPPDDATYDKVLRYEKNFIDAVAMVKQQLKFVDVYYTSGRSIDDAVNESTMSDVSLFSITFCLMIFFACIASGNFFNPSQGHALLATSCVISVGYGIISGLGLGMWLGIPFISIVGILPFLVLGVGLDDMFIIVNEFDRLPRGLSVVRCVSMVMTRTGSSITMTTLTTLVAYLISTSTSFLAIRYFCLYAAFCIGFSYLFVIGFFVAALSIDGRRIKVGRADCLPCLSIQADSIEDKIKGDCDKKQLEKRSKSGFLFSDRVMKIWATFILKRPSKIIISLVMLAMISGGVAAAMNIDQRFDQVLLAKPDSYFQKFLGTFEEYYSESLEVSIITDTKISYEWWKTQKELLKLSSIAQENKYYENKTLSWIEAFKAWPNFQRITTTGDGFLIALKTFLSLPQFHHFNQDVVFSKNNTEILASRILVYTKSTTDTTIMCEAMVAIRKDLKTKTPLPAYAVAKEFLSFEHYILTPRETIRNIIFSSIAILIVTSVYLVHPAAIFLVFINFVCLVTELIGILHLWGIPLNTLAMVGFVMAVGYSVDYMAHVAHAFILARHDSADERVIHALATVGSSVFWGGKLVCNIFNIRVVCKMLRRMARS